MFSIKKTLKSIGSLLIYKYTWWRHQMETFSALLAICAGNSPVPGEFPTQRPVTRSFDVFFDLRPNKRLSKQSWGWWFETLSHPLRRHRNDLFENLVRPILLYGSDGWGVNASIDMTIDKLFYQYMRCVLNVKSTASNVIVVGECGQMPPSLYCHINTLSYLKRLQDLPDTKIVKQVFNELNRLHLYGVKTFFTGTSATGQQRWLISISPKDLLNDEGRFLDLRNISRQSPIVATE